MFLKYQSGAALMYVLMIMVVLGILGLAFSQTVISGLRQSSVHGENTQAFYNARSAALIASEMLSDNLEERTYFLGSDFEETDENGEIAKIVASDDNDDGMINKIEAFGYAGPDNRSEEKITLNIQRHGNNEVPEEVKEEKDTPASEREESTDAKEEFNEEENGENVYERGNRLRLGDNEEEEPIYADNDLVYFKHEVEVRSEGGGTKSFFGAEKIHFESELKIMGGSELHLYSYITIFHEEINLDGANSKICFYLYEDYEEGYVYLAEEDTFFRFEESGTCLSNNENQLEELDDEELEGGEQIIWE